MCTQTTFWKENRGERKAINGCSRRCWKARLILWATAAAILCVLLLLEGCSTVEGLGQDTAAIARGIRDAMTQPAD